MLSIADLLGPAGREQNGPIKSVEPLENGSMRIVFVAGGVLEIPIGDHLEHARLCPLKETDVFFSAATNGMFIRWYREGAIVADLSWEEAIQIAVGKEWL